MGTSLGSFHKKSGTDVPVADGGTGASSASAARANLGVDRQTLAVTVATGEILALNATPKELIPAQGVGTHIIVDEIVVLNEFASVAYVVNAAGLSVRYTDGTGVVIGTLTQAFGQLAVSGVAQIGGVSIDGATNKIPANAAVVLFADASDPTTGDGAFKVSVSYRVVTFA